MRKDGDLRSIFRHQFGGWQWTNIELGIIGSGVPDSEFCTPEGKSGWIEFKFTKVFYVQIKPFQVSWLMRRCRYGGNAWIAVRRIHSSGSDELWLMKGDQAEDLYYNGLEGISGWKWGGGVSGWNFQEVERLIIGL